MKKRSERLQDISLGRLVWNRIGILMFNSIVTHVPSHLVRLTVMRLFGASIGRGSTILRGTTVLDLGTLTIGTNTSIGWRCMLDARGGLTIGDDVVIASDTHFIAGGHDFNDPAFPPFLVPTTVGDHVWVASRSTILGGAHLGRGAVVGACSLVTSPVGELEVVAGVPAEVRSHRDPEALSYSGHYRPLFY